MTACEKPKLEAETLRELHQLSHRHNFIRLSCFLGLYVAAATGAVMLSGKVSWIFFLPLWIIAGASLHGISLFTHEAVHGTLSRNKTLNAILGAICAWPVWQNYSAYRVLHLEHHADLGGEHDPDHYSNYTRWTWGVFALNWLRLLVGYPVYITAIPILGWKHGTWKARGAIALEIACCGALVWLAWIHVPHHWLLHAWLAPMLFINTMVNIRGMSQHTLLERSDDEILGTRSILTGPVVRFFMCNENYHLEHHLYPGIPWYRLASAHRLMESELRQRGAPFIRSYTAFVMQLIHHSFKRGPWNRAL
jgi:fatty acid desaturase